MCLTRSGGLPKPKKLPQDGRTERHKSEAAPHLWLALRYGRHTAISHARPPAVLGVAPQTAERIRGHTLAAMFWFVARLAFLNGVRRCRVRMLGALCKVPCETGWPLVVRRAPPATRAGPAVLTTRRPLLATDRVWNVDA